MQVDIDIDDPRWADMGLDAIVLRAGAATLAHLGHDAAGFELSVLACDDARIRTLNAQFRGKDSATNVLSWPTWDLSAEAPGALPEPPEPGNADDPEALGDMALAYETCLREAAEQNKPPLDHVTHLIVHSVLHLLGYDHETDPDAELMEETERSILAQLGIADPYATEDLALPQGIAGLDGNNPGKDP
ncbi:MAG: rRNA maturation RNase YbeY [Rhodobacteraceae bacterium]|jgi:probable rRNA maturation factor|nr:rRNA maturation RNase YbeY [Paracoccaceae bacterium]